MNPTIEQLRTEAHYPTREARTWLEDSEMELGSRVATDLFRENRNRRPQMPGLITLRRRTR